MTYLAKLPRAVPHRTAPLTGGKGFSSLPDYRRSLSSHSGQEKSEAAPGDPVRAPVSLARHLFPDLKAQAEIDREYRRERMLFQAERIVEGLALAVVAYAGLVFAGVMQ